MQPVLSPYTTTSFWGKKYWDAHPAAAAACRCCQRVQKPKNPTMEATRRTLSRSLIPIVLNCISDPLPRFWRTFCPTRAALKFTKFVGTTPAGPVFTALGGTQFACQPRASAATRAYLARCSACMIDVMFVGLSKAPQSDLDVVCRNPFVIYTLALQC